MPPVRRWIPAGVVVIALLAGPVLLSQATKPNPAYAAVKDDESLPRVLLIGDSISIGYTLETRLLLAGKANLHRIPENGGPTIRGLEKLSGWLGDGDWDVIHFNWGLHDLKLMDGKHQVPIQDYEKNLRELVGRLRATGAKLIWATTTPVPAGELSPPRRPGDVIAYNKVAGKIMDEGGIGVDDLYAFALPRLAEIQRPANVHFTEAGSAALAGEVAARILKVLGR